MGGLPGFYSAPRMDCKEMPGAPARFQISGASVTNLLISVWCVACSMLLMHSGKSEPDARSYIGLPFVLIILWAALQRRRWGRLALVGICRVALLHFVICYIVGEPRMAGYPAIAVILYVASTSIVFLWLQSANVVKVFEYNKSAKLAPGQRAIALAVGLPALAAILSSVTS